MKLANLHRSRPGRRLLFAVLWAATILAAAGAGFLAGRASVPPATEKALVARVIDGDTIDLADGRRIRYIGIDAPEAAYATTAEDCYAAEATARNRELVDGKLVELQTGTENKDRYGRLLRYVYVGGIFVNAQLVAEGCAYAASYGTERRYQQILTQLQQYSKLRGRGLWSACP